MTFKAYRHHFVRDLVNIKEINIEYTSTDDMAADVLTKGLPTSTRYQTNWMKILVGILVIRIYF